MPLLPLLRPCPLRPPRGRTPTSRTCTSAPSFAELLSGASGFVFWNDSGAKDSNEHHAQLASAYLAKDDVVVRLVIAVDNLGSTTGAA